MNHRVINVGEYEEQGFSVLPRMLPPESVLRAREEFAAIHDGAPTEFPEGCDEPMIVFWLHVRGGRKRYMRLREAPALRALVTHPAVLASVIRLCGGPVRLLETIVFNKPPGTGSSLAWHQDASFYPLDRGIEVSALIPLDPTHEGNGAVSFAIGSHRDSLMSAVDLQTGQKLLGDERAEPGDPRDFGYQIVTPALSPGDVILISDRVWHGSRPNTTVDQPRRMLSVRYISIDTVYRPIPGNAASFMRQITSPVGQTLSGGAFPILDPNMKTGQA